MYTIVPRTFSDTLFGHVTVSGPGVCGALCHGTGHQGSAIEMGVVAPAQALMLHPCPFPPPVLCSLAATAASSSRKDTERPLGLWDEGDPKISRVNFPSLCQGAEPRCLAFSHGALQPVGIQKLRSPLSLRGVVDKVALHRLGNRSLKFSQCALSVEEIILLYCSGHIPGHQASAAH